MDPHLAAALRDIGKVQITGHMIQTVSMVFFYGIGLPMVLVVVHISINRGLKARGARITILASALCFILYTMALATRLGTFVADFESIRTIGVHGYKAAAVQQNSKTLRYNFVRFWSEAILLSVDNCILVWRAAILLFDHPKVKIPLVGLLLVDIGFKLGYTSVISSKLGARISLGTRAFDHLLDHLDIASYALTLSVHVITIAVVWYRLRRRKLQHVGRDLQGDFNHSQRILSILVETGLAFGVTQLADFILSHGILPSTSLALYLGVQCVPSIFIFTMAIYPMTIMILVDRQKSLVHSVHLMSVRELGLRDGATQRSAPE